MSARNKINLLDRLIRALPLSEDPTGTARPLWRDYSKHNGYSNPAVAKANGVAGIAARAGISWGYQDPFFDHHYIGAGIEGLYRTSYHVIYAGQPALQQADNWYKVHPERDIIPRIIDLEVEIAGLHPEKYAQTVAEMSEIVLARDGVRPWIYSRYLLINAWLSPYWSENYLNAHYYFLAQYRTIMSLEHAGPPTLPNGLRRDRVVLHQTACKKAGYPGEVESAAADYDRWELGDSLEMYAWIAAKYGGITPPEPPPEPPGPVEFTLSQRQEGNRLILEIEVNP
jgi:hypothetical protein